MSQNRHESERASGRQPSVRGLGPSLELLDDLIAREPAALQLDWCNPRLIVVFADEQQIATFLFQQPKRFAIEIDHNMGVRYSIHLNVAAVSVAIVRVAAPTNRVGDHLHQSVHASPFCCRLKIAALSLYRASLTAS